MARRRGNPRRSNSAMKCRGLLQLFDGKGAGYMVKRREAAQLRQGQFFKGRQFTGEVILWAVNWAYKWQWWGTEHTGRHDPLCLGHADRRSMARSVRRCRGALRAVAVGSVRKRKSLRHVASQEHCSASDWPCHNHRPHRRRRGHCCPPCYRYHEQRLLFIGRFATLEDAATARREAAERLYVAVLSSTLRNSGGETESSEDLVEARRREFRRFPRASAR